MNTTIPLLHDNHNHVALYGALGSCLDVSSMQAETALDMLKGLPSDRLSVVRGWKSFELHDYRYIITLAALVAHQFQPPWLCHQ